MLGLLLLAVPVVLTTMAQAPNEITSPAEGATVKGSVSIEGTAAHRQFGRYQLDYAPDPNPNNKWVPISGSPFKEAVTAGELATWDTTALKDGTYMLRLRVVRADSNYDESFVKGVKVANKVVEPAACPACPAPAACPAAPACPTCPACPEASAAAAPAAEAPFTVEWAASAHADKEAEAFTHWDEEDPKEVPTGCAACHSEGGYLDFMGADGSPAGVVDKAAPIGTSVTCNACHNKATLDFDLVTFPSGITLTVEGPEARCMVCHQGRASAVQVDKKIADAAVADDDTISAKITFSNVHYKAAAATLYGAEAKGGYEYAGKAYDVKFEHEPGVDTCIDCHDSHSLELKVEGCYCHDLESAEGARDIREAGSLMDYDGDGDVEEGIYYEIQGLQEALLKGMQVYATEVSTQAIGYDAATYPYFFGDDNANGTLDEGEGGYKGWTGRLSKAAYNYQFSLKDPGAYAHNGKYIIELLYDSIEDLNAKLATPVDMSKMHRNDAGHFDASAEAWRHWDGEPAVEGGCVKCHQAEGLPQFVENGANIAMPQSSSMQCSTCHNSAAWPARHEVTAAPFPSGAELDTGVPDSNLCLECHQGRSSTVQVDKAVADKELDTVMEGGRFINVHYFAAGATLFGTEAKGAYEYEGKEYAGRFAHTTGFATCIECHDSHMLAVKAESCAGCHPAGAEDLAAIRMTAPDYDGDGDTKEGVAGEIGTIADALLVAIQDYAAKAGAPIQYDGHRYPYFIADPNANGTVDEGEGNYAAWTPRLLKAAYNYQYSQKDPGAYAHNAKYVVQFLYDSIEDLGGDVSKFTRP